jgi:hypothetical protein
VDQQGERLPVLECRREDPEVGVGGVVVLDAVERRVGEADAPRTCS